MTMSNKLFLITALMVGMNTFTYDAVGLKNETTNILNFAQTLEQQPTTAVNSKVAQWLQKGLANENYTTRFSNETIIEIARILNNNPTTEAKIIALLTILADKEAAALENAKKNEDKSFVVECMMGACTAVIIYAILCTDMPRILLRIAKHDDIIEYHQLGEWTLIRRFKAF
jgi:hypothetical protein